MDSALVECVGKEHLSGVGLAGGSHSVNKGSSTSTPKTLKSRPRSLPLKSLNHVSIHCKDVSESLRFYRDLMGFVPVKRPTCLDYFDGAWLFNYGIGIHLLKDDHPSGTRKQRPIINPRSDHLSFQCEDVENVESLLEERGIPFVRQQVVEHGIIVDQLFFHDPDDHMIEICNCDALPVEPLPSPRSSQGFEYLPPLQTSRSSPGVSDAATACTATSRCSLKRASQSLPGSPAGGLSTHAAASEDSVAFQKDASGMSMGYVEVHMGKRLDPS